MADVAYYYPAPFWWDDESAWAKSLLLFFDRIAILLPGYMYGRHHQADPTLTLPLEERGLLQVLEPAEWVDQARTEQLATLMVDLLTAGAFDDLPKEQRFAALSYTRLGYGADVGLGEMLVDELSARGLARPTEDGVSVPLHPFVRTSILVLLGQIARQSVGDHVSPITNNQTAIADLLRTLAFPSLLSAAHVVRLDLEAAALNLELVPLDDVLSFRFEHMDQHRRYRRDLAGFLSELSAIEDPVEREHTLETRREEINEESRSLHRLATHAFGSTLTNLAIGIAGAAWSVGHHDQLGAVLSALSPLVPQPHPYDASAYSFLFSIEKQFGG